MRRLLCVVGTRPEGIKMAPVIQALKAEPWAHVRVLATPQHRDMLDQVLMARGGSPYGDGRAARDGSIPEGAAR